MLHRFLQYISSNNLFAKEHRLLLAVSGGVDSVVLCDLCFRAGFSFAVAHCNFGLRGAESDRDEAFVAQLAAAYGLPFFVQRFDTRAFAAQQKLSLQEAARKLRYHWFDTLVGSGEGERLHFIVTAHHLDDNIETVLMNFFKGTGITGLRGMLPKQNRIIRPLLFAHRAEIEAYAQEHNLSWVHDSSNDKTEYTRNYFRLTILPLIEKVYPDVRSNLAGNLQRFAETELLYRQAIEQHKKKLVEYKGAEVHLPVLKLAQVQPLATVLYEILKPYNFSPAQTAEAIRLLQSESGRYIASPTHRLLRNRNWLILSPLHSPESTTILIERDDQMVLFGNQKLTISREKDVPAKIPSDAHLALLDAKEVKYPLLLRPWKQGDYFYPLGMRKKKKLARFFIDLKLSKTEKERVWVLESHKKIIWVVGLRIDDRFKITENTQKVIRFQVAPV